MDVVPFGKYDLLERIAAGGMAEVFLARTSGLAGFERRLVIKRIRDDHAKDPRFVQSFVNEARIGVHLNHPNIVQMYELGRVGEAWFIAMEHLHGRDLSRLRKAVDALGERLPAPVAVRMVADVCRALSYAHARTDAEGRPLGLVHRDVSPHNVVVTFTGEVKLVDFGIARLMLDSDPPGAAAIGGGKYAYMSPEQARGEPLDQRTDIYSAGIVLYELLVGHRLFQHPDPEEKLRRVRDAVVPDPKGEGIEIDPDLWAILIRALARDREERPSSAADLEEDLRAWLFAKRHRVERTHLARSLRRAFPEEASRGSEDLHLDRLVADLGRLQIQGTDPGGEITPSGELPGRLSRGAEEQRPVVVLMVDVDGLTSLSERVTPEVLFRHRLTLLRWLRRITDEHEGTVHAAVDDHITVFFGVPRSRSSDVRRALACALQLVREVRDLRGQGLDLDLCIGVHAGEVTLRSGRRRSRYVAKGNTTRLARRLSAIADHGQVLASQRVVEAVEGEFDLRRGPAVPNRGDAPPLPSWEVRRTYSGLRRRGRGSWVARGTELAVVQDALRRLQQGRGSSLAFVGDAGSGKSRLLRELRELALRRSLPFHGVHVSALAATRPHELLRDLLASIVGEESDASRADLLAGVERLSELALPDHHVKALRRLIGASSRSQVDRDAAWRAIQAILRRLARSTPLVLALDDAHYLPDSTLPTFLAWLERLSELPILILVAHRPPLPEGLAALVTQVGFPPMGRAQLRRMARELLGVSRLDEGLVDLLVQTTEGNPRYLEEVVKHLASGQRLLVEHDIARLRPGVAVELPHTLQALITARIDALDPAARGALRLAAVAGDPFSEALLADAAGLDDPTPLVQELAAHNLVSRIHGTADDWRLSSELVRSAALRGTMGAQRTDYHRLIAGALERRSDDLDTVATVLMEHCAAGGRLVDAARYAFRAGQAHERAQAYEAARDSYGRGLELVERIPDGPDSFDAKVQGDAMLHLHLGRMQLLLGEPRRGQRALGMALEVASEHGLPWVEIRAHLALGRHHQQRGALSLARAHIDQAMALRRLDDDPAVERETLEAAAHLAQDEARFEEARRLWEQARDLAGSDAAAAASCALGLANLHIHHDNASAIPLLEEALRLSRLAGDRILEGRALNNLGLVHLAEDRPDDALHCFRTSLQLRAAVGYQRGIVINEHNIAEVHFRRGDESKAAMGFARSRELADRIGWPRGVAINDVFLRYLEGGSVEAIAHAADHARSLGERECFVAGRCLMARRMVEEGRPGEARALVDALIAGGDGPGFPKLVHCLAPELPA